MFATRRGRFPATREQRRPLTNLEGEVERVDPIELMLSELQQSGLLDSHGEFSIDFGQALKKMGKQLLPDARMYVLRFYQSALCCGAERVTFTGKTSRLQCVSLGPPVPLDELRQLSKYLAPDPRHPAASYLATALQAALSTRPLRLQLVTWDGKEGASLTFVQGHESLQILSSCPFSRRGPQSCLWVERGPAWFFRQVPEFEWLRRHGGVGRTSLRINDQPVKPCFGAPRELVMHKMYLPGSYISITSLDGKRGLTCQKGHHVFSHYQQAQPGCPVEDRIYLPGGPELTAAVGIRADLAGRATLRFVRHGIMLPAVQLKAPVPGLDLLISSAGLRTDLAGLSVVQDDAYHQVCQQALLMGQALWTEKRGQRDYRNCIAQTLLGQPRARYSTF